eukprot:TRINITY_DN3694_c0_g1_i3.p1 TRINITY_DN3694_c0_g1~~TRINITY_DN3694_c0_g1_i3.p1  ORF type:complete len:217 (+),score=31.17 TRINITY_DN3694_c0_g1_i3:115-765(+)
MWTVVLSVIIVLVLARFVFRSKIYDFFIVRMTVQWYHAVLVRLEDGARLLDVGIGTGTALIGNKSTILNKNIHVTGIDYDLDYVVSCSKALAAEDLDQLCTVIHKSVYEFQGGPYDAAYFSGSLMIMPDPAQAIDHVGSLLRPGGQIFVTQTFERKKNVWLEKFKPLMKYVSTIDFGHVTYEEEFVRMIEKTRFSMKEKRILSSGSNRDVLFIVLQ